MEQIVYIDRASGKQEIEKVYGAAALKFIYGSSLLSKLFGKPALHLLVKNAFFSACYGYLQKLRYSKKKIRPFIKAFQINTAEFAEDVDAFNSFDDFFTRKLKPSARPIADGATVAIIPADARYLFFQNIATADGFAVKGEKFNLTTLLNDAELAKKYDSGAMVMARLCPTDYHRYHFPCDCTPGPTRLINGWLYSVNPIAIKQDIHIFTRNKRTICELDTPAFGKVLFLEIGATNVGSINQTYTANTFQRKGNEKGFFSFGASSLILLFEPGRITIDPELLTATSLGLEMKCLMGQSLGIIRGAF